MGDPGRSHEKLMIQYILKITSIVIWSIVHLPDVCSGITLIIQHGNYGPVLLVHPGIVFQYPVPGRVYSRIKRMPRRGTDRTCAIGIGKTIAAF